MTVYLAPFFIILVAAGCDYFSNKKGLVKYMGYVLALLLVFGPLKNSIAQVAKPYLFGEHKKSYHREALHYVDAHYQTGDAVYIYWNELAGYKLYKRTEHLKFSAVLGKDYRHTVDNYDEYFTKVDAEIHSLPNTKRVWVISSNIDMKQGDYMSDPAWYYNGTDYRGGYGIERFRQHLLQIGKVLDTYVPTDGNKTSDVHVTLMELK
jgi:hypothetical protein